MNRLPWAFCAFSYVVSAQGLDYIKANYTKFEYRVPVRDGKRLFTSVYVPKETSQPWPILFDRTPYSVAPYGEDNYRTALGPSELFGKDKFIFVYQDVRGRYLSEGEFVNMRPQTDRKRNPKDVDESTDTYDTIEWLIKNIPNNNGRVGMWGISYPGFYTSAGIIDAHPALKCASPQAPIADWFIGDDFHHNGALYLPHAFAFLQIFGQPRPEPIAKPDIHPLVNIPWNGYEFYLAAGSIANFNEKFLKNKVSFWNEMLQHPNYDAYWQARNLRPHLRNIKPAVMTVGGWFDAEDLFGALNTYQSIERQSSPGTYNTIVMGPWFHGGWARGDGESLGPVRFNSKTSAFYRENIELPFFKYWLKGGNDPKLPEAYMFETGTNQWRKFDGWPPKEASPRTFYLHSKGKLSFDPPSDESAEYDEYISDPDKPIPYVMAQAPGMTREYMVDDQRLAGYRTDVLVYQTDALAEDLTIAGPVRNRLRVSTSGTDSDFVVKLIDVYPEDFPDPGAPAETARTSVAGLHMGGYQQLLRAEIFRGKFRNSFEKPEPFVPGQVTGIEYVMPDAFHTFRRGHRVMVQIQSSWFPLADRNPQKFMNINEATGTDFVKATERIYHRRTDPSSLTVNVLPRP